MLAAKSFIFICVHLFYVNFSQLLSLLLLISFIAMFCFRSLRYISYQATMAKEKE